MYTNNRGAVTGSLLVTKSGVNDKTPKPECSHRTIKEQRAPWRRALYIID